MDIHEKVYVPEYSIQGEDIPLSITWDKSRTISIVISFSENIEIIEVYNADESNFEICKNSIKINGFEENGYLGLALQTKSQNYSKIYEELVVKIECNGEEKIIIKRILLFRPDIKLINAPKEINIISDGDALKVENRIVLRNFGEGTGILKLKEMNSSELKIVDPQGMAEFYNKVMVELEQRVKKLKDKYPQFSELIDRFIETKKIDIDSETIEQIKRLVSDINSAFETNRDFMNDFIANYMMSFINNLSFIIPLESLLEYLRSINVRRVILSNPISVLRVTTTGKIFNAKIIISDLVYNAYDPIVLEDIKIKSNVDCEVPLYLLFEFQ